MLHDKAVHVFFHDLVAARLLLILWIERGIADVHRTHRAIPLGIGAQPFADKADRHERSAIDPARSRVHLFGFPVNVIHCLADHQSDFVVFQPDRHRFALRSPLYIGP